MSERIAHFFERRGLAVACVLAPIILGVLGNMLLSGWVNKDNDLCAITRVLPFTLIGEAAPSPIKLSEAANKDCDAALAARIAEAAPSLNPVAAASPSAPPAAGNEKALPSPRLQIVANHIAGRLNVAYAYEFLLLVSTVAFFFGSYVVIHNMSVKVWLATMVVFAGVTAAVAILDVRHGALRRVVADNILARADADALLQYLPGAENLRTLIIGGLCVGYFCVGMVLASLYVASIRQGDKSTLSDLKNRLMTIRVALVLGSAILVSVVLASRAVFDWPLSLLIEVDRKALAPAADALVRKWGAIGSVALIAAFLPAITAWYLDRDCYRNLPQPTPPAPPMPDAGELEIAPLGTVTSVIAILAPVIASPVFDAFKGLVGAISK